MNLHSRFAYLFTLVVSGSLSASLHYHLIPSAYYTRFTSPFLLRSLPTPAYSLLTLDLELLLHLANIFQPQLTSTALLGTVRTPQPQNLSPTILKTSFTTGPRISIPNPYISSCYFPNPLLTRLRPPPSRHSLNSLPAHRSLHRHPHLLLALGGLTFGLSLLFIGNLV
jgi:hypothetical protein